jgi:SAM-dependent methyltransferase
MPGENVWINKEFSHHALNLNREALRTLYPSEAWSLYRIIPDCCSVLDMGCGNGNKANILRLINANAHYSGLDFNDELIDAAAQSYPYADFFSSEAEVFLKEIKGKKAYDCIMAWAFFCTLPNYFDLLDACIDISEKYILFDLRVINSSEDIHSLDLAYTSYNDIKEPYFLGSFSKLKAFLQSKAKNLKAIEISGYEFPVSPEISWIDPALPTPVVLSVVLEKKDDNEQDCKTDWFVKLPDSYCGK